MATKKTFIIVDGYSSGSLLAKAFNNRGYQCIHIRTAYNLHPYYNQSVEATDYVDMLNYHGDFQQLCTYLKSFQIVHALAGFDMGIPLADKLNQHFHLPGNDPNLSQARYNKYQQRQILTAAKQFTLPFYSASNWPDLCQWLKKQTCWPIILKPINSASAQDVYRCQTLDQAQSAFQNIKDKDNHCGQKNDQVLAEAFLSGREYRVNTVSYEGKIVITDLWDMTKVIDQQGRFIYDKVKLLPANSDIANQLINYIKQILTALKINYGPTTSDIVMTNNGPILVELGARLMGGMMPMALLRQSLAITQLDTMITAYSNQQVFRQLPDRYTLSRPLTMYLVRSQQQGQLKSFQFLNEIRQLPSVQWLEPMIQPGDLLHITKDYQTSPIHIILSHPNSEQIEEDLKQINSFEQCGLFNM